MLCLTACESKKVEPIVVTKFIYVAPDLYFPKFPAPQDGIIIPLDADYKMVTEEYDENGEPVEVVYSIVPEWWLNLVLYYKLDVDTAQAKYEAWKAALPDN